jgi:5-methyltetrahydropteroyltriglutamate--homocysteine methyltransferase
MTTEELTRETATPSPASRTTNHRERHPLLTSVVGSYSVPEWLGRFNTDFQRGRISAELLNEVHETAIKSALVDQEVAGLDVVSDGEFRRDNDMDYFIERIDGIELSGKPKEYYFDYYGATATGPLPSPEHFAGFGLVDDLEFLKARTTRGVTISLPGAYSLSRRITNRSKAIDAEIVLALAALIHTEAVRLTAAGATRIQLDEPYLAGHPDQIELAVAAVNIVTADVDTHVALHVCYGNRYARPAWEGHYDFLFPAVLDAGIDELVLEFGRKGLDDLELFRRFPNSFELGAGVIDVKSHTVETPEVVADRLYQALKVLPPERLVVNPDCGLRHLPSAVARAKLESMVAGAAIVRADVLGERGHSRGSGRDALAASSLTSAETSETPADGQAVGDASTNDAGRATDEASASTPS